MHPVPRHLRTTCWLVCWMLQSVDPAGDSSLALCFTHALCVLMFGHLPVQRVPSSARSRQSAVGSLPRFFPTELYACTIMGPSRTYCGFLRPEWQPAAGLGAPVEHALKRRGICRVCGEAIDHRQPSAITACCTAIDSMPRNVRAHPDILLAGLPVVPCRHGHAQGRAQGARSRHFSGCQLGPQHDEALQTCGSEPRVGDPITSLRNSKRCPVDVRLRLPCAGVAPRRSMSRRRRSPGATPAAVGQPAPLARPARGQLGPRAPQLWLAESVNLPHTAWRRAAAPRGNGQGHAQSPAQGQLMPAAWLVARASW